MKLSYLWHGLPGHPIHPPLTDATVGIYTFATIAAFMDVVGITSLERRLRLVDRPPRRSDRHGLHRAHRLRRLADPGVGQRNLEDGDHPHGRDGQRDRFLRARSHLRSRRLYAWRRERGCLCPDPDRLRPAHPWRLARRRDRLRPRHARPKPRRRAGVPRSHASPTSPKRSEPRAHNRASVAAEAPLGAKTPH